MDITNITNIVETVEALEALEKTMEIFFDILLTAHLNIILVINQINAQFLVF